MSGYIEIVRFFLRKLKNDHVGAYAAQATLFIVMSVLPFGLILTYFLRFTPITVDMIINGLSLIMPDGLPSMIETVITEVYQNSGKMLIPAFIIAIYSAGKAVQSLRYSLNIVYDIQETRSWFALRFRAMCETFLLILIIFALMLLVVFGKNISEMLDFQIPIVEIIINVILKLRFVIVIIMLTPFFCFIYKFLPNRKCSFKSQLVGAIGCTGAWLVFSLFLFIYIYFFNGFSLYGTFTFLLLAVFWLNICLYIFLVCGAVNSMLEILWAELKSTHAKNKIAKEMGEEKQKRQKREPSTYGQYIQEQEKAKKEKEEADLKAKVMQEMGIQEEVRPKTMEEMIFEYENSIDHPQSKG